jgi:hypothetical protein
MRARYQELAAKGLMTLEELGMRLEELEITRRNATHELDAIRQRCERLKELERDKDTLLESYAGAVSGALESLEPEERHRVYEMLRLRVVAHLDGTLEAHGILSRSLRVVQENGRAVCTNGDVSSRNSSFANRTGLRFRALLSEDGTQRVGLARI